jgi:hypothetical protein
MNTQSRYEQTEGDRKAGKPPNGPAKAGLALAPVPSRTSRSLPQTLWIRTATPPSPPRLTTLPTPPTLPRAIKKLGVGAADAQSLIKQQLQVFNIISLVLGGIGGIALLVAAIGVIIPW